MQGIDHYENFPVASWLCPAHLRPAIMALYDFARTADDLADEGDAPAEERLEALHQYRADLQASLVELATDKQPSPLDMPTSQQWLHVFEKLAKAVSQHALPTEPLFDLLDAFEQDVIYTRDGTPYTSQEQLMDYCRRSANPVGRLLLSLYDVQTSVAYQQSDAICSALQLINFWQDRVGDMARGRDYLPVNSTWTAQLAYARDLMMQGAPLVHQIKGRAGWELRLVVQGGLRILHKLETKHAQQDPSLNPTLFKSPKLTLPDVFAMIWHAIWM